MKGWLVGIKQGMTKLWLETRFVPVTLVKVVRQEVVRYKTDDKDWYESVVIGVNKKQVEKEKWQKISYDYQCEFGCDSELKESYAASTSLSLSFLEWVEKVSVTWISKGKGFQWGIKRHNFAWGPASHWSKFHRALGSTWNRKPRRTNKGQPMAWRMGGEKKTHRSIDVVAMWKQWEEEILALKWSLPWARNSYLKISLV